MGQNFSKKSIMFLTTILLFFGFTLLFKNKNKNLQKLKPKTTQKKVTTKTENNDLALLLDLLAATFEAGLSLENGLTQITKYAAPEIQPPLQKICRLLLLGTNWKEAWQQEISQNPKPTAQKLQTLENSLRFIANSSAAGSEIIYLQANEIRRTKFENSQKNAAKLAVKLVLPVGLCFLPAFILLTIAPAILFLTQNLINLQ